MAAAAQDGFETRAQRFPVLPQVAIHGAVTRESVSSAARAAASEMGFPFRLPACTTRPEAMRSIYSDLPARTLSAVPAPTAFA